MSTAAAFFAKDGEATTIYLVEKFMVQKEKLQEAYKSQESPQLRALTDAQALRVAKTRKALGLPPEKEQTSVRSEKSYRELLSEILSQGNKLTSDKRVAFSRMLDPTRSPDDILADLKKYQKDEQRAPGVIWGIETPRLFSIQYGGTDYRIPSNFLATVLLTALCPLVLAWMGAFYVTRQRELLAIRESSDYRQSFPHILNVFPVIFVKMSQQLGFHQSRRVVYLNRRINGLITGSLRCSIVALFMLPMVGCLVYSAENIFSVYLNIPFYILVAGVIVGILFLFVLVQSIVQEAIFLYRKDFYA